MDGISFISLLTPLLGIFMIFRSVSLFRRGKQTWRELLVWIIVWGGIGFVGYNPAILDVLPPYVGIKSGVNALIFFGFVVLFYGVFRLVVKVEELEKKMVEMVRDRSLHKNFADGEGSVKIMDDEQ